MEKLVEFKRRLYNDGIIKRLKNDSLFKDKLLKDIKKGVVYPTIRENRLNFYYYKKLLFEYEDRFITNSKFAFVPKEYHPTYVADGNELGAIANFYDGYENIKERAKYILRQKIKAYLIFVKMEMLYQIYQMDMLY